MEEGKRREIFLGVGFLLLLLGYVFVNWSVFLKADNMFFLTTIGIFMLLVLIALVIIHGLVEDVKREIAYTIEDNIVEVKLLKDLTEKQIEEMKVLHNTLAELMQKKPAAKKK
jgi:CRISPR/Cas system-associated protein endoribonuclease Cas2